MYDNETLEWYDEKLEEMQAKKDEERYMRILVRKLRAQSLPQ
jgi:hypothetical protein